MDCLRRLFFESLYAALIHLVDEAYHRLQKRADIEYEIGDIFRSKHFNLYKRKNLPPRYNSIALPSLFMHAPSTGILYSSRLTLASPLSAGPWTA